MLTRFVRHLAVAASLVVAACTVQAVSPYNPEIARGLVRLNTSILSTTTDVARNAQNPKTQARAAFENYAHTYDAWLAQVETMRTLSDLGNPGALDCATVAKRLGSLPGLPSTDLSDLQGSDGGRAIDCQTLLFERLKQHIERLADYHKQFCAPTNPNILADCAGGFGAKVGPIHVNGSDEAVAVQPTLRAIRLLMRIQALKKPTNP
ncbi:MAG: hypothetical protein ACHQPH_11150 [Reyranellales bacterium]